MRIHQYYDPIKDKTGIQGKINGWLYLLVIGLVLAPLIYLGAIFSNLDFFNSNIMNPLFKNFEGNTEKILYLSSEKTLLVVLFTLSILTLIHFFKKRSSTPNLIIALLLVGFLYDINDSVFVGLMPNEFSDNDPASYGIAIVGDIVKLGIWWPILKLSGKVKETFTVGPPSK